MPSTNHVQNLTKTLVFLKLLRELFLIKLYILTA